METLGLSKGWRAGCLRALGAGGVAALLGVAVIGQFLVSPVAAQTLTVSNVEVNEGGTATVTLELSAPADFAIRYTWFTRDGTARATDDDYQKASGFVYINDGDWSGSVEVKTKSDSAATEEDETFFIDFKSLHTLGRRQGTYSWVYDNSAGLPTDVSAEVTIKNVVAAPAAPSTAACVPWHQPGPWPPGFPCSFNRY